MLRHVIQRTPNIKTDFKAPCQSLLPTVLSIREERGKQLFPTGVFLG